VFRRLANHHLAGGDSQVINGQLNKF